MDFDQKPYAFTREDFKLLYKGLGIADLKRSPPELKVKPDKEAALQSNKSIRRHNREVARRNRKKRAASLGPGPRNSYKKKLSKRVEGKQLQVNRLFFRAFLKIQAWMIDLIFIYLTLVMFFITLELFLGGEFSSMGFVDLFTPQILLIVFNKVENIAFSLLFVMIYFGMTRYLSGKSLGEAFIAIFSGETRN